MSAITQPGRYAIDADGRLYSCRGRWRTNAVAIVVVKPKCEIEPERPVTDFPGIGPIPDPAPCSQRQKISLRGIPSSMESLADSWRRKGA